MSNPAALARRSAAAAAALRRTAPTVTATRSFKLWWWGHDTLEDKEARLKAIEDAKMIRWTDPKTKEEKKASEYLYCPTRIQDEAEEIGGYKDPLMSYTDSLSFLQQPVLPSLSNLPYYYCKSLKKRYAKLVEAQLFDRNRVLALGPDLAAAYFLSYRNCRVRFRGHDDWLQMDKYGQLPVPRKYEAGWYVEAIDASDSLLVYEGFHSMRNLAFLKYLDLSYSAYVDNFVVDRLTGEYKDTLEYLDLSGCADVDSGAIESLWRLRKLKVLLLHDMQHVKDINLVCLSLLEVLPELDIRGVDYLDTKLLKGTEHEDLAKEMDSMLLNADKPALGEGGEERHADGKAGGGGSAHYPEKEESHSQATEGDEGKEERTLSRGSSSS